MEKVRAIPQYPKEIRDQGIKLLKVYLDLKGWGMNSFNKGKQMVDKDIYLESMVLKTFYLTMKHVHILGFLMIFLFRDWMLFVCNSQTNIKVINAIDLMYIRHLFIPTTELMPMFEYVIIFS